MSQVISKKMVEKYCASMKNPPKSYGSIEKGLEVSKYRSERLSFHADRLGCDFTPEVRELAQRDVISKFGLPS